MRKYDKNWIGDLTPEEYDELLALEYVLTWGYTDNPEVDEKRYKYLSAISWATSTIKQKYLNQ